MKSIYFTVSFLLFVSVSFCQTIFPEKMPGNFKIEWRSVGGMSTGDRTIILKKGECIDLAEGWEDPEDNYSYSFTIDKSNMKQLSDLYSALKKLHAFSLKMDGSLEESYPGEGVIYTVKGKKYQLGNYAGVGIAESDMNLYKQSITLILDFAKTHRN